MMELAMSDWTTDTLKEYIEALLKERDKALKTALVSINDRLKLLNELRGDVATKQALTALEKVITQIDKRVTLNDGKSQGFSQSWAILVAVITIALVALYLILRSKP